MSAATSTPGDYSNLDVALRLACHGIAVFPCKPDKSPYTTNGFKDAVTDEFTLQRWWTQYPDALPAVACASSNLIVIDCDIKDGHNGVDAFKQIAADYDIKLYFSPSVQTQSGGAHCYFTRPADMEPTNKRGSLPNGIDVRSAGYTIAPGTKLPNGKEYTAMGGTPDLATAYAKGTIPPLPPKLRARIEAAKPSQPRQAVSDTAAVTSQPNPPTMARSPPTDRETAYAAKALADTVQSLARKGAGSGRNTALNDAALAMGELIGAGWIDRSTIESTLRTACEVNGYLDKDGEQAVSKTLRSGIEAGMRNPRAPVADNDTPILPAVAEFVANLAAARGAQASSAILPRLWTSKDFVLAEFNDYVVKGLLAPGNVGAILGHPGAGKSTLAPYLAYAVAQGFSVFGMRTRKGRVLYIAAEDEAGIKRRLFALGRQGGHTQDCAVMVIGNLRDPVTAVLVSDAVTTFKPTLVILDTMAAAFAGMDENASADMGQVVAFARSIAGTGAAVLLIAHPAKAADGGTATARGHGSLNGTLDMALVLTADDVTNADALVRGTMAKNRNGSTTKRLAFRKTVVVLGQDTEGDSISTTLPVEVADEASAPEIDVSTISDVQDIVAGGLYRRDWQSREWIGHVIGNVFGLKTPISKSDRKDVEAKIARLIKDKWLDEFTAPDSSRKPRKFVCVGVKVDLPSLPTVGQP